jgi:hypothetical protein
MSRLSSRPLSISWYSTGVTAAGALGAAHAGDLVRDLADAAEPGRRGGSVLRVVALEQGVAGVDEGERLRLPFMIRGGRLLPLGLAHRGRIGGVDAVDHIGKSSLLPSAWVAKVLVGSVIVCLPWFDAGID